MVWYNLLKATLFFKFVSSGGHSKCHKNIFNDKTLIAIARKLLTMVWHVLKEKQPYNPGFLPVYDPLKVARKANYHRRELMKLAQLGYGIS
jgi:hypothetical protein